MQLKENKVLKESEKHTVGKKSFKYIIILLCVVFIAFYLCLENDWTNLDDDVLVTENPAIKNISINRILQFFTTYHYKMYHPLVLLSYSIEYKFFKLNPSIYHTTNVILHLLNTLLVFFIFHLISKEVKIAFSVAILFGIHPLHVESVAWVSERKDVLYLLFFLFSIFLYLKWRETQKGKYWWLSLFSFILSLFSKSMAVTLPFILILIDWFIDGKINIKEQKNKIFFIFLSFVFSIITILAPYPHGEKSPIEHRFSILNILDAGFCFLFYFIKTFLPLRLSCIYPDIFQIGVFYKITYYISLPVIAILFYYIFKKRNIIDRNIVFGILLYFITLLPVLQIIPVGISKVADRYTYFSLVGIFYIFSYYIYKKYKKYFNILLFLISVPLIILTMQRCRVWKNSMTLWSDVLKKYPEHGRVTACAFSSIAIEYLKLKDYEKAILYAGKGIEIEPSYPKSYVNRGIAYGSLGKYELAMRDFIDALKLEPLNPKTYNNIGICYSKMGRYYDAIKNYDKSIEIDPNAADTYYNRAISFAFLKDYHKAMQDFQKAIELEPYNAKIYSKRGSIYLEMKDFQSAQKDFTKAIQIDPSFWEVYVNYGNLFFYKNDFDNAISCYTKALSLNWTPDTLYNRLIAYWKKGDYEQASKDADILLSNNYKIAPQILNDIKKYR